MNETDLRVIRTRQNLINALHEMLLSQSFDSITVSEIVKRALINRATFYAHFHDKYDLLDSTIGSLTDNVFEIPAQKLIQRPFETFFKAVTPAFWDLFNAQIEDSEFRNVFKDFATRLFKTRVETLPADVLDEMSIFIFLATVRGLIDWVEKKPGQHDFENLTMPRHMDAYFQRLFQLQNID
ncbi:MAG TPA: TetR family transcriptional regulator [Lactobacillaceae bacterium]|jgi:AcrR family transcriptional regulator